MRVLECGFIGRLSAIGGTQAFQERLRRIVIHLVRKKAKVAPATCDNTPEYLAIYADFEKAKGGVGHHLVAICLFAKLAQI